MASLMRDRSAELRLGGMAYCRIRQRRCGDREPAASQINPKLSAAEAPCPLAGSSGARHSLCPALTGGNGYDAAGFASCYGPHRRSPLQGS